MSCGFRTGLAGIVLAGALTAPAHAGLLPTETLGPPLDAAVPAAIFHAPGDQLTATWVDTTVAGSTPGFLAERDPGQAFGPLTPLGDEFPTGLVVNASGMLATGVDTTKITRPKVLLRSTPGADFVTLPVGTPGLDGTSPVVGIDSAGDLLVAFTEQVSNHYRIAVAGRPAGGSFSAPSYLSPAGVNASTPHLAMNANGDAVVAWVRDDGANHNVTQAVVRPVHGAFTSPKTLAIDDSNGAQPQPSVAIDEAGRVAVAAQHVGDDGHAHIVLLRGTASTGLGGVETATTSGDAENFEPSLAYADDHTLLLSYRQLPFNLIVSSAVDGGGFGAHQLVSGNGANGTLWADGHGHVALSFATVDATTVKYNGAGLAYRPPGGPFAAPEQLELMTDPVEPFVAYIGTIPARGMPVTFDSAGDPLVGWTRDDTKGTSDTIDDDDFTAHLRMDDIAPPTMTGSTIPASGTVGQVLTFSAAATDVASTVGLHWDFGDGSSADGPSVMHAFGAPGTRTVTVTATDGGGNTAAASGAVAVVAVPVTPVVKAPVLVRCHVPTLTGHTEAYAKKALTKGHCKLGTVKRPTKKSQRHSSRLRVKSQTIKHGTYKAKNAKVGITLAIPKAKTKKTKKGK